MITAKLRKPLVSKKAIRQIFSPLKVIVYLAIIVAAASAWSWWLFVRNSESATFWGMVDTSLRTTSLTKSLTEDDGSQVTMQTTALMTTPEQKVFSKSVYSQTGAGGDYVATERIGTPQTDYVRYTKIDSKQQNAQGKQIDFSSIVNVWGKAEGEAGTTNAQLYNEAVLGIIPVGNLNAAQRTKVVKAMREDNAYTIKRLATSGSGLKKTYTYEVSVRPEGYIKALKIYAAAVGLKQLTNVDPGQYKGADPISVEIKIDGLSRQLRQISYSGGTRVEKITAYGSQATFPAAPSKAISVAELQSRLQTLQ